MLRAQYALDGHDLVDTRSPTCGFKSMILSIKNLGQFHLLVPNIISFFKIIYRMMFESQETVVTILKQKSLTLQ